MRKENLPTINGTSLVKDYTDLNKTPKEDHFNNVLKAAIGAIPVVGSPIASLMNDYIPSRKQKRILEFVESLSKEFEKLKNISAHMINTDYILSDEFSFILETVIKRVSDNYQKDKLSAYKAILLNSLCSTDVKESEKEYFLNLVNNLTTLHIRILSFLYSPKSYLNARSMDEKSLTGGFSQMFGFVFKDIDLEIIKNAFQELYDMGLVNTKKDVFYTMTSSSGLHLLGDRTSNFGKRFIKFITFGE